MFKEFDINLFNDFDKRYQRDIIKIVVEKITDLDDLHLVNFTTTGKVSRQTLQNAYKVGHSTVRTQLFKVICAKIPNFVALHFRTHSVGIDHYVQSRRPDISGLDEVDRFTPTNYTFYCNAQSLMNMALERMCSKFPSFETQDVFAMIRDAVQMVDADLAINMIPHCVYRNGLCKENKSCGLWNHVHEIFPEYYKQFKFVSKPCSCNSPGHPIKHKGISKMSIGVLEIESNKDEV